MDQLEQDYRGNFIPSAHRLGMATLLLAIGLSLSPALYLSFVLDAFPGIDVIFQAFIVIAAFVAVVWFIEPISYFPMLGVSGSYMTFLSGNAGNMRLPVAIACQKSINAPMGSKKAELATILGIGVSVMINLFFVLLLVLLGNWLIDKMPDGMIFAFKNYTFASIYAAVFVMFFTNAKARKYALMGVAVAIVTILLPISKVYNVAIVGVAAICISLLWAKLETKEVLV